MNATRRLLSFVLVLSVAAACTGEPAVRASAPDAPTSRLRGLARFAGDTADLTACGRRAPVRLLPSSALASARAALPVGPDTAWSLDIEAAPTADSSWDIAAVHRLRRAEATDTTDCLAPLAEVDARDSAGRWMARFATDTLIVVRRSTSDAVDTLRLAASRAPAIDGTVLYRATVGASGPRVTLVVSPIHGERGLREGTAQVNTRVEGCVLAPTEWRNASARLVIDDQSATGCAMYVEPLRDPSRTRRRF